MNVATNAMEIKCDVPKVNERPKAQQVKTWTKQLYHISIQNTEKTPQKHFEGICYVKNEYGHNLESATHKVSDHHLPQWQ